VTVQGGFRNLKMKRAQARLRRVGIESVKHQNPRGTRGDGGGKRNQNTPARRPLVRPSAFGASFLVPVVLHEVLDVEGPEGIGLLGRVGMNQVPDALGETNDVLLCFTEMPRRGLRSRYGL
jgi:hypothetical protein